MIHTCIDTYIIERRGPINALLRRDEWVEKLCDLVTAVVVQQGIVSQYQHSNGGGGILQSFAVSGVEGVC